MSEFNPMGGVYPVSRLTEFIKEAFECTPVSLVNSGRTEYFNIPAAFDIETSSWNDGVDSNGNPRHFATMYIWQLGINGVTIYGRRWEEFGFVLETLEKELSLSMDRRLVIYVHNLGYEFQFIRKYFNWDSVFAMKRRRPVYAISGGFEFRCSLFLSNYSLEYIGDNLLTKYKVRKLVGDLDYSLIRHSYTPINEKELNYCVNDVRVVMSYIKEKIENDGDITQIPLTNTGYVRNFCRKICFYEDADTEEERHKIFLSYKAIMNSLQVQSADEYNQLKRAFMGGFTHAGVLHANRPVEDVEGMDIASSYPFTFCLYFPMGPASYYESPEKSFFLDALKKYCCIFDIEFENLEPAVEFENILSESRCKCSGDIVVNNGRIVKASKCLTTLTELDFENVSMYYTWTSIRVANLRTYRRGYLPKALILSMLKLYEAKTSLKDVEGREIEYLVSKMMLNAIFGMAVTDIVRDEFIYDSDTWSHIKTDKDSAVRKYNKNFNRFLFYAWGVYVTAHARQRVLRAIYHLAEDYIYSDTDSVKFRNYEAHKDYFEKENDKVYQALFKMCSHYGIPFDKCCPRNPNGEKKILGVWEHDTSYELFLSAGAKRYCYLYKKEGLKKSKLQFNITVSGLNKKFASPYLIHKYAGGDKYEVRCLEFLKESKIPIKTSENPFIKVAELAYAGDESAISLLKSMDLDYYSIFPHFGDGLIIPAGHTGKMTLSYIDDATSGIVTDYRGIPAPFFEMSSIYMEPQSYLMSQLADYLKLLDGIYEEEY